MTHDPRESPELDQALLEHYRRHSAHEPSPALDARILAAAHAHAAAVSAPSVRAVQKPPLLSRVQGWLVGGSQRARWSMAFASIATLGIGVGLAMRTLERAPEQQFDAAPLSFSVPAPAPAPAMAPKAESTDPNAYYAAEPQMEKKSVAKELTRARPEMRKPAAPVIISGELNEQLNSADAAPPVAAAPFADAAVSASPSALASKAQAAGEHENAQLQRSLKQILQLQDNGHTELAEQQLHTLQQLHPGRDLRIELQRLRALRGQQ